MIEDRYPEVAGYRDPTTSRENAERIEQTGRAANLRSKVRAFFENGGEATADELAIKLDQSFRSIQPRVSELRVQKVIRPTGERRTGSGGGTAHVWQLDPNWRSIGEIASEVTDQLRERMKSDQS